MTFKSTKIKMEKTRKGKIYGDTVGVRLSGKIKRSKFDLGLKFVPAMIADDIRIIVDCEFTHE